MRSGHFRYMCTCRHVSIDNATLYITGGNKYKMANLDARKPLLLNFFFEYFDQMIIGCHFGCSKTTFVCVRRQWPFWKSDFHQKQ